MKKRPWQHKGQPYRQLVSGVGIVITVYEREFEATILRSMRELFPQSRLLTKSELARLIDHTLLKPTATASEIETLCNEALEFGFWSVCVSPAHVEETARRLVGSGTRVCAVVSFPFGWSATRVKLLEAQTAMEDGARELDMMSNIGALKSGKSEYYFADISEVAALCRRSNAVLKVILECCNLTDDEKVRGARLAEQAGADFVKTSTGFGAGGATVSDVALLRSSVSKRTGVKAAGGISTLSKMLEMLKAGADRIGTSSGARIMRELPV
jgi:deoxyribose-phosphate aldolase